MPSPDSDRIIYLQISHSFQNSHKRTPPEGSRGLKNRNPYSKDRKIKKTSFQADENLNRVSANNKFYIRRDLEHFDEFSKLSTKSGMREFYYHESNNKNNIENE